MHPTPAVELSCTRASELRAALSPRRPPAQRARRRRRPWSRPAPRWSGLGQARRRTSARGPTWSKAVKSAALEAAGSSTRGSGWAPSGPVSSWEC
eukprot:scaffold12248_cov66-Phaeocystis_antarctica.AAC.2